MKLRIAAVVALAALTLLAGCNKGASNNANGTTTSGNSNAMPGFTPAVTPTTATTSTPTTTANAATPTEAFQLYFEAVKRNDGAAVKSLFSRATIKMLEDRAAKTKKSFDDVFNEGFEDAKRDAQTSTYETSNEKINGDRATLDVKDSKRSTPITLNFVREGGGWKLSFVDEGGDDAGGDDGGGDHDGGH